jgi:hypothetical protein
MASQARKALDEGHGFSRTAMGWGQMRALAPEVRSSFRLYRNHPFSRKLLEPLRHASQRETTQPGLILLGSATPVRTVRQIP